MWRRFVGHASLQAGTGKVLSRLGADPGLVLRWGNGVFGVIHAQTTHNHFQTLKSEAKLRAFFSPSGGSVLSRVPRFHASRALRIASRVHTSKSSRRFATLGKPWGRRDARSSECSSS